MSEISKKDLLAQTKISYGQLYRWKREGLIPEEWFVKKSAFTGQETYFPREEILARIEVILAMKDTVSLEDIRRSLEYREQPRLKGTILDAMLQRSQAARLGGRDFSTEEADLESWALAAALIDAAAEVEVDQSSLTKLVEDALSAAKASGDERGATGFAAQVSIAVIHGKYHYLRATSTTALSGDSALTILATRQLQVYRDRAASATTINE